jgi:sigma-B regulation protein RsbU (phosphoserine phosphatase)
LPRSWEGLQLDNTYIGTKIGISYRYSRSNAYNPDFDPRARGWYTAAMAHPGKPIWTDTYLDVFGILCVTCAVTYNGPDGKPVGGVGADITLTKLKEDILATKIGQGGFAFLLDKTGKYIAHPHYDQRGFDTNPLNRASGAWLDTIKAHDGREEWREHRDRRWIGKLCGPTHSFPAPAGHLVLPCRSPEVEAAG